MNIPCTKAKEKNGGGRLMPNYSLPDSVFRQAAEQFRTPFHLYDEHGIRERARKLNSAFSWCPDFREYFAVKALPNPAILRILKEEGCGADCSSSESFRNDRGEDHSLCQCDAAGRV